MRSEVTFKVEHGDSTDPFTQFIDEALNVMFNVPETSLIDYEVKVDL